MADDKKVDQLREKHELSEAEALFVVRQSDERGVSEDEAVQFVKDQRVGSSATGWDNVSPGGHAAPASPNTPEERLVVLEAQRARIDAEIDAAKRSIAERGLPEPEAQNAPTADATPSGAAFTSANDATPAGAAAEAAADGKADKDKGGRR